MRWWIRALAILLVTAPVPVLAQAPTLLRDEMPHIEMSVGAAALYAGPGRDFEGAMRALGLDRRIDRRQGPSTSPPGPLPGVFAQVHGGVARHLTVGVLFSGLRTETVGRAGDGGELTATAVVKTTAAVLSYRPNPWLKFGIGPAVQRNHLWLLGGRSPGPDDVLEDHIGWVASGEAKFARSDGSATHPPAFGYFLAQYRGMPRVSMPGMPVALPYATDPHVVDWPSVRLRSSHWLAGVGVGIEF